MKNSNNKTSFIHTKKKIFYAGVALVALMSLSSPSQSMEVAQEMELQDNEKSRVRCLWHLELKPAKNKVYRAAALEILEKKALQEQVDTKIRLNYLKKLGQFIKEHPDHPLGLELLKMGEADNETPLAKFYVTSKKAIEDSHLSSLMKTFQIVKLQTFYLHLPQSITQLSHEKRESIKEDINQFTTSLLLKGGREITKQDLNYFKSYYDLENPCVKDLEKLLHLTNEISLIGKINYKLGLNIIESGDICKVSAQEAFFSAAANTGHSLGAFYRAELYNTDSDAHRGAGYYQPDTACISYSEIVNEGREAKAFPLASYKLAKFYETGLRVDGFHLPINLAEARENLVEAAMYGHPYAQYELVRHYMAMQRQVEAMDFLRQAAESGYSKAQFELAQIYEEGYGNILSKDPKLARFWYHKAADQEEGEAANYPLGYAYELDEDYTKAISFYEKSKDPCARVRLGKIFLEGKGTKKNESLALEQFQLAAFQGNADGNYCLGLMQLKGQGFQKPMHEDAFASFILAAEQKHPEALFQLGIMKQFGIGTEQNYDETKAYYKKAKTPAALYCLGGLYKEGLGGEKKVSKALKVWEEAANLGHRGAAYRAGKTHLKALRDSSDNNLKLSEKARFYLEIAGTAYIDSLYYLLGITQEKGIGCEKNPIEADKAYIQAADAGHADAQFKVGEVYERTEERGWECIKKPKALKYYTFAANQHHKKASRVLSQYHRGNKSFEEAERYSEIYCYSAVAKEKREMARIGNQASIDWFKKEAEKYNPHAQYDYAKLLEEGVQVGTEVLLPQDINRAIDLYKKAAKKGKRSAQLRLDAFKEVHLFEALGIEG